MNKDNKNRLFGAIAVALTAAIASLLVAYWNPLEKQQLYLSNFLYYERPTENQVVVISIDDQTVSPYGLGKFSSWCRTNYVPVLQKLAEFQPAVIGVDILFLSKSEGLCKSALEDVLSSDDPSRTLSDYADPLVHPDDQKLGDALRELSQVVLLADSRVTGENGTERQSEIVYPLSVLWNSEDVLAHAKVFFDATNIARKILPLLTDDKGKDFLSLPLLVALKSEGVDGPYTISQTHNRLSISGSGKTVDIPLDDYQIPINYTEAPLRMFSQQDSANAPVRIVSFLDIYNSTDADWSFLKDKIVLIGAGFKNSGDNKLTPLDSNIAVPGVMIHAQAIQTILDRAWLRNLSFPEQGALILLLALAAAGLIFRLRISLALPLLAVIVLGYEAAAAPLLFRGAGVILNMVYPPLTVILVAIIGYAYRYVTEFRQKTRVAGALGQYVNREVAEQVLEGQGSAVKAGGGERRPITVLFTDIRGFTTISEGLQPQSVVALLNEYLEVMAAEITRFGGTLDKYEGDAIMAFFEDSREVTVANQNGTPTVSPGAPAVEHHAIRAARAALAMRAALPKLNAKWANDPPLPGGEKKPQIDFRVGLSSGEAIVGNIGTSEHIQYTVIGDIVNLGSRLESANKKYHTNVMIAEATFESIKDVFACRFLDRIRVKGKNQPVGIYELLCEQSMLPHDQRELLLAYNQALDLYFNRDYAGTAAALQENVLKRWPRDNAATYIAARCEKFKIYPPAPDWDFVYDMDSK